MRTSPTPYMDISRQVRCRDLAKQACQHIDRMERDLCQFAEEGLDRLAGFEERVLPGSVGRPPTRASRRRILLPDGRSAPCLSDCGRFPLGVLVVWASHTPRLPSPEEIAKHTTPAVRISAGEVVYLGCRAEHKVAAVRDGRVVGCSTDRHRLARHMLNNHRLRTCDYDVYPIERIPFAI